MFGFDWQHTSHWSQFSSVCLSATSGIVSRLHTAQTIFLIVQSMIISFLLVTQYQTSSRMRRYLSCRCRLYGIWNYRGRRSWLSPVSFLSAYCKGCSDTYRISTNGIPVSSASLSLALLVSSILTSSLLMWPGTRSTHNYGRYLNVTLASSAVSTPRRLCILIAGLMVS